MPKVGAGGCLGAFALTEPGAGSDAAAVRTTAILDEDAGEHVINGEKNWVSQGTTADVLLTFAQTGEGTKGIAAFVAARNVAGAPHDLAFLPSRTAKRGMAGENRLPGGALACFECKLSTR